MEKRPTGSGREQLTPKQIESRIRWDDFPENSQRVISGFLEELQTGDFADSELYEEVVDTVIFLHTPPYSAVTNSQIARELHDCVEVARNKNKRELAFFLNSMLISIEAIARPRRGRTAKRP